MELTLFKQTGSIREMKDEEDDEEQAKFLGRFMGNSSLKLTQVSDAPIRLNALEIFNLYGTMSDI